MAKGGDRHRGLLEGARGQNEVVGECWKGLPASIDVGSCRDDNRGKRDEGGVELLLKWRGSGRGDAE